MEGVQIAHPEMGIFVGLGLSMMGLAMGLGTHRLELEEAPEVVQRTMAPMAGWFMCGAGAFMAMICGIPWATPG